MAKDPLLPLKLLVYGMGIFLVGGFLWIGVKISMKAGDLGEKACREVTLERPANTLLADTTKSDEATIAFADNHWLVTQSNAVWRFKKCGKFVQRVTLARPE